MAQLAERKRPGNRIVEFEPQAICRTLLPDSLLIRAVTAVLQPTSIEKLDLPHCGQPSIEKFPIYILVELLDQGPTMMVDG